MKIAVDASQLHSEYTGVGRYIYNILKNIAMIDPDIEYVLISSKRINIDFDFPNIYQKVLKSSQKYLIWANTLLVKELKSSNYDILWSPNYYIPIFYKGKSVVTIHDISWKALPDNYSFINRMVRDFFAKKSIKQASMIITDSNFSKNEILNYYSANSKFIKVIHLGIDSTFKNAEENEIEQFKKKHGLENSRVIGFLGSLFRRRNIDTIIYSYKEIQKKHKDLKLILVGKIYDNRLSSLLKQNKEIIWLNRISENEINAFYSCLDLFIFLSEYEGFGFPPLEALSCGTVPIILNKTSLKELFENFSLKINTPNVKILSETINEFLMNKSVLKEQILGEFSNKKDYFNWRRVANEHLNIFKELNIKTNN